MISFLLAVTMTKTITDKHPDHHWKYNLGIMGSHTDPVIPQTDAQNILFISVLCAAH